MKKINYFLLCVLLLFVSSCTKNNKEVNIKKYDESNINEFIDLLYDDINNTSLYLGYDLRSETDYLNEHLKQLQNCNGDLKDIINNSSNDKYDIFIFSETELEVDYTTFKAKNIYILITSYDNLRTNGDDYFIFDSGEYDCGC